MFPVLSFPGVIHTPQAEAQNNDNVAPEKKNTDLVLAPQEEQTPVKAEDAEKTTEAESPFWFSDIGSIRIESGHGYASAGVSNDRGASHSGYATDLRLGFDFNLGPITLAPELSYSHAELTRSHGDITSYFNKHSIIFEGRVAYEPIPQWLNVFAGLGVGWTYLNSGDETDGTNGGGLSYANNFLKYNVDDERASAVQFRIGLGSEFISGDNVGLGLNAYFQVTNSTHALVPDAIDRSPTDPAISVDSMDRGVFAAVVGRFGPAPQARRSSEFDNNVDPEPAEAEAAPVDPEANVADAEQTKPVAQEALDKIGVISQNIQTFLNKNHSKTIKDLAGGIDVNATTRREKEEAFDRVKDIVLTYNDSDQELQSIMSQFGEFIAFTESENYQALSDNEKKPVIAAWAKAEQSIETLSTNLEDNKSDTREALKKFRQIAGLSRDQRSFALNALRSLSDKAETRARAQNNTEQATQTIDAVDGSCPEGFSVSARDGDKALKCTQN